MNEWIPRWERRKVCSTQCLCGETPQCRHSCISSLSEDNDHLRAFIHNPHAINFITLRIKLVLTIALVRDTVNAISHTISINMSLSKNLVAAGVDLLTHNRIFIYGEWHRQAPELSAFSIILPFALWTLEFRHDRNLTYEAFTSAIIITGSFFAALFTSMVVYRIFFHFLRKYPGPVLVRVTKLWHFYHCRSRQNHFLMKQMRKQFGDHVRIGKKLPCLYIFTSSCLH